MASRSSLAPTTLDPNFDRTPYDPMIAYGRSKTANILFAVEFDRRHRARGVRAAALHPGGILTELGRHMQPGELEATPGVRPYALDPEHAKALWAKSEELVGERF